MSAWCDELVAEFDAVLVEIQREFREAQVAIQELASLERMVGQQRALLAWRFFR